MFAAQARAASPEAARDVAQGVRLRLVAHGDEPVRRPDGHAGAARRPPRRDAGDERRRAAGDEPTQALLEHAELGGAYSSADTMSYDEVVEPAELRNALLAALRLTAARRSTAPTPVTGWGIRP